METKDCREMSDEELQEWRAKLGDKRLPDPGEEHRRRMYAMQNPVRREILAMLKNNVLSVGAIASHLKCDEKSILYHLQFLQGVFFVTVQGNMVDLTPPGVAYLRNVTI
ncbi:MAG: hypothetical protein RBG13Loki_3513 [Promethearchaeota archaeon CR_4]|nr:MAG: hypothetical protein RBG13Loki_3513 [Candidatus Lokiarchaeota archaeon CR_4]